MLQLWPNCECCDKDLPPPATDARIRTYECTFCADCVANWDHQEVARFAEAARDNAGAPLVKPELVQKGLPWNSSFPPLRRR